MHAHVHTWICIYIHTHIGLRVQVYLFDFVVTANFVVGAALVIASTFPYGHICKICPTDVP